jgi:hypothetical protein
VAIKIMFVYSYMACGSHIGLLFKSMGQIIHSMKCKADGSIPDHVLPGRQIKARRFNVSNPQIVSHPTKNTISL